MDKSLRDPVQVHLRRIVVFRGERAHLFFYSFKEFDMFDVSNIPTLNLKLIPFYNLDYSKYIFEFRT